MASSSEPRNLADVDRSSSSVFSRRSMRQLGLFVGGAAFAGLSAVITRRALVRRYRSTVPKFYQPSNSPNIKVDGPMEAVDALSIATVNVSSFAVMLTGGALWAFDISSLDDLRRTFRGAPGDRLGASAEEDAEEWLAAVLARREQKERARKETGD